MLLSSCVRADAANGQIDDPAELVLSWTIEAVTANDARVEALQPGPLQVGGHMAQSDGTRVQLLFNPATCPLLPNLRVRPMGDLVELELLDPEAQMPCADREFIYVDLQLAREFRGISTTRAVDP